MYSFDDDNLGAKKKKFIDSLDQMSQMAQDKIAANPEAPVPGQDQKPSLTQMAGQMEAFKGQQNPAAPQATSSDTTQAGAQKSSTADTIKSILGYALPMAFSASRGMGLVPGALGALSSQNKADVVSNQQAIERVKENNEAQANVLKNQMAAANQRIELEKLGQQNAIAQGNLNVARQNSSQAGSKIPSEVAKSVEEAKKLAEENDAAEQKKKGYFTRAIESIVGREGNDAAPDYSKLMDVVPKKGSIGKSSLPARKAGETFSQYKQRTGQ